MEFHNCHNRVIMTRGLIISLHIGFVHIKQVRRMTVEKKYARLLPMTVLC